MQSLPRTAPWRMCTLSQILHPVPKETFASTSAVGWIMTSDTVHLDPFAQSARSVSHFDHTHRLKAVVRVDNRLCLAVNAVDEVLVLASEGIELVVAVSESYPFRIVIAAIAGTLPTHNQHALVAVHADVSIVVLLDGPTEIDTAPNPVNRLHEHHRGILHCEFLHVAPVLCLHAIDGS